MSAPESPTVPDFSNLKRVALRAGLGGTAVWLVFALIPTMRTAALQSWLVAFLFWIGLALGSLAIVMLHHLVGGAWGFLIRRPAEAAASLLPAFLVAFLPIGLGLGALYPWAEAGAAKTHPHLAYKIEHYLNAPFFWVRALVYFTVWSVLAFLMYRGSAKQDSTEDPKPSERLQGLAGPGLVLFFFTVTFAAIDWAMSLEPEWYSTIYGAMLFTGMALSALAGLIIVASLLARAGAVKDLSGPGVFHDLGNLMLAFTMLWAYTSFSQYLIIWSGNLAEEVPWYLRRSEGFWRLIAIALMIFHFFTPFFILLFRENKRRADRISRVAAVILAVHLLDLVWLVLPSTPAAVGPGDLALIPAFLGLGGLFVALFLRRLEALPLVPVHDPLLANLHLHAAEAH